MKIRLAKKIFSGSTPYWVRKMNEWRKSNFCKNGDARVVTAFWMVYRDKNRTK